MGTDTAVCFMSGDTECLLFDAAVQGIFYSYDLDPSCVHCVCFVGGYQGATGVHGSKRIHRICIKPFQQFWRRDQTAWAVALDLCYGETACLSESGVTFPTRVEDVTGKTNKNSKCTCLLYSRYVADFFVQILLPLLVLPNGRVRVNR